MKGYQKKVIFLKDTGSHLFDEAYFVISREGEEANVGHSDMIFEANRIINESLENNVTGKGRKDRRFNFVFPFFLGAFLTLILSLCIYFLVLI